MDHSSIAFLGFSEPISSITHLLTALFFLVFGLRLIWLSRGNALRVTGHSIYIFCATFLFSMSGVYHLLEKGTTSNYVLQILDHAGIYLMISGSFVPFHIILLRGLKRWLPLIMIWILAITGVCLTSIFFKDMPEWLLLSFFISMGWMSIFTCYYIKKAERKTFTYLFLGGSLYTIGAIIDFAGSFTILPQVLGPHEVFHLFVSAAALTHFYAVYRISKFPISDKLVVMVKQSPQSIKAYFTTENALFTASTIELIKSNIKTWIENTYPQNLKPKEIKIKYFNEEKIKF